jgi:hypothetical protein
MDGRQPPEQTDIVFGAVEGVYGPQKTPMLWQCIIARIKEPLRAIHILNPPPKYIHKLGWLLPIHSMYSRGAQCLMRGARGPFLPMAAMVVGVVMTVAFCAKATEILNDAKNTKISCFYRIILSMTIYCTTY